MLLRSLNTFFHARTNAAGVRWGGWMRIGYAFMFLVDRLLLGPHIDFFLSSHGVLPLQVAREASQFSAYEWTLFQLAPDNDFWLWTVYLMGLLHGFLLLLGVAPRWQILGIMIHLISFQHHNIFIHDGMDNMMRIWCFLLFFLPLHRITIYDGFRAAKETTEQEDSWPMWPFRLWQIESCLVYVGAAFGKLDGSAWLDGTAIYWLSHVTDIYPGVFNPEIIFNRMLPLKLLSWASVALETVAPIFIWIPALRKATLISVIMFHIGIDFTMNMHFFEWLTILGWTSFLVEPVLSPKPSDGADERRRLVENLFLLILLSIFFLDTTPSTHIRGVLAPFLPEAARSTLDNLIEYQFAAMNKLRPVIAMAGLRQGWWTLFSGMPTCENGWYVAKITMDDESTTNWRSPKWDEMPWWKRKMDIHLMSYYDKLEEDSTGLAMLALCKYLARTHGPNVASVELFQDYEEPYPPREDLGWFEPARKPMRKDRWKMVSMYKCEEDDEECAESGGNKIEWGDWWSDWVAADDFGDNTVEQSDGGDESQEYTADEVEEAWAEEL